MSRDIRLVALEASPPPGFRCGRAELDEWLANYAVQATRAGSARAYLAHDETDMAVGYLALAAGEVQLEHADERMRRGMPRHDIPAILLARLAVADTVQRQGIGRELIWHAAALTLKVSRIVGVRVLVVDALDEPTAGFYEHVDTAGSQVAAAASPGQGPGDAGARIAPSPVVPGSVFSGRMRIELRAGFCDPEGELLDVVKRPAWKRLSKPRRSEVVGELVRVCEEQGRREAEAWQIGPRGEPRHIIGYWHTQKAHS